ncbi:xylulokinase [Paraburkholderia susongensis]|uniref:Xylulose kinase n=1 Tax=Paraburkholderia susongensis TaxID=1515439 RepID=A0A1X7M2G6_9BURK|nr:xylulokinase [Paraburkholderia susongensis]
MISDPISLGVDLGTSELKALMLDEAGAIVGSAAVPIPTSHPRKDWSEQDPRDWWNACVTALDTLRRNDPAAYARITCIGLSGQMHGAVLVDARNECLRPAILWNDGRSSNEAALLAESFSADLAALGCLPMAGLTAPKLLWLKSHEPDVHGAIDCVMSPKDYLRLRLTGRRLTDMSDAAGTLWLDVRQREWFEPMIAATGLRREQLPELIEGTAAGGTLLASIADQLHLGRTVVVAGGAGDNPASSIGIGACVPGRSFVTLGTSAAVVTTTDRPLAGIAHGVHGFCHAIPGRWYAMGAILSGASCLKWAAKLLAAGREPDLLASLSAEIPGDGAVPVDAPIFLPYLAGERTPHNDPQLRGGFLGLALDTSASSLGYAVLEGVAFALRDALASIEASGVAVGSCSLVGGGARSGYWAQLLADVLGRELHTLIGSEFAAGIGAARLGFAAYGIDSQQLARALPVKDTYSPQVSRTGTLEERYCAFRSLVPAAQSLGRVRHAAAVRAAEAR